MTWKGSALVHMGMGRNRPSCWVRTKPRSVQTHPVDCNFIWKQYLFWGAAIQLASPEHLHYISSLLKFPTFKINNPKQQPQTPFLSNRGLPGKCSHHNGRHDRSALGASKMCPYLRFNASAMGRNGLGGKGSDSWNSKGYFCSLTVEATEVAVVPWPNKRQHPGSVSPQGSVIGL